MYVQAAHDAQLTITELPEGATRPPGHAKHVAAAVTGSDVENVPFGQDRHTVEAVMVVYVTGRHARHVTSVEARVSEYVPDGHTTHTLAVVEDEYVSAGQVTHVTVADEYVPVGQEGHSSFVE